MLDGLAAYLESVGIGTVGTDIFKTDAPATTNTCIIIYPTGGFEGEPKLSIDNPTFQIYARSVDPSIAYNKLAAVYSALESLSGVTLDDGTYIIDCTGLQSQPAYYRKDENNPARTEYSINFRFEVINKTTNRE